MTKKIVSPVNSLKGEIKIPGDKSISHRAVMFGAIADGKTTIEGFLPGEDCLSTISCFQKLGVQIEQNGDQVTVYGNGWDGLKEATDILDVGNSGTTTRLMMGILATRPFHSVVIGDASIAKRPMARVTVPLKEMGAKIDGRGEGNYTPLAVRGGMTKGITYNSPVASAQVKSAILLAGLQSEGVTTVTEPHKSRDHTERMLKAFGVELEENETTVSVRGGQVLKGQKVVVPGDISSAAFFLVAGAIVPNSEVKMLNVGVNETRIGIIDVLTQMGAKLTISNERVINEEKMADLTICTSSLKGIEIGGEIIPRLIDEIPVIAVLATQANGTTVIKDAEELKVKETNRIDTVVGQLKKLGANIEATEDGMIIHGPTQLTGGNVDSFGDHRIGMAMAIAGCIANGKIEIEDVEAIDVSYPTFFQHLQKLV
ncbi:3-phosphoshikimate 1-carboxyvinyltransferase [Anaerobacillus alkalilacustris]|uniref:3-phosphoshikimate 1-carboxyvinyltransferase n=1 Tax=Anaerobacillus alkalilacustris TaxID=393763 RepID=A0A1S2LQL7_9BACI|nr:3-phosphoshikimate 1-carboxyvinyltransferase [Anaerobacillus alkalilacustris]OIJ14801.1 3-phosphoshikimate 1-carboxyvinyltransferase [Anaerobacillus alkalilacustris]